MEINATPFYDMSVNTTGCCSKFDPQGWDNQILDFRDKLFVRATSRSLMHVPINMGTVFTRVEEHVEDAGALDPDNILVLSRDLSGSEEEHLFAVARDVPEEEMTTLSGRYLSRVFEGPYRRAKDWVHDLDIAARAQGNVPGRKYLFYTTCPRCARAYGENFVVGFVELLDPDEA